MATIQKNLKAGEQMKIDRLVSIIMILLDKKRVGAQELADMFEVSPRTIYRDIESINVAGIPIHSTSGVGGGFEIMPNYKIDRTVFSSTDLSMILLGLSSLTSVLQGNDLVHAHAKVKNVIPPETANDIEIKMNQLSIDLSPWLGNTNLLPHLEMIKAALQEHKLLSFDYVGHHGNKTSRMAEPYQLVLKNSQWYWQGYCLRRNDFRLFKLSRTLNLQIQPTYFTPRANQKPQLDFTDHVAAMQTSITLRIHHSVMDRVLEYCPYDHFSPEGTTHYRVRFPFVENDYHYDILLSFGAKCECLEPAHVRKEMQRRIHALATLYEN